MALGRVGAFGRLVKFSHSIFALPFALVAVALAVHQGASLSGPRLLLILVALVCARTAAMGFNRLVDLPFDERNPRTKSRELPSGQVSIGAARWLVFAASLGFVVAATVLSPLCGILSPLLLFLLLGYSYTKRVTWACHGVLGLALGAAPLGAWIAMRSHVGAAPVVLALGVATWVAGFDILYATADVDFDRQEKLHSIPARFGVKRALVLSGLSHAVTVLCYIIFGELAGFGWIYRAGTLCITAILVYEHSIVRPNDLSRLDAAFFTLNGAVSIAFLGFALVDMAV